MFYFMLLFILVQYLGKTIFFTSSNQVIIILFTMFQFLQCILKGEKVKMRRKKKKDNNSRKRMKKKREKKNQEIVD